MSDARKTPLTDAQKACLLLVASGGSSKEIGPILGLAYRTVDQYVNDAQHLLGASDRRAAARIISSTLEDHELKKLLQKFPRLAERVPSLPTRPQSQRRGVVGSSWQNALQFLYPPLLGGGTHELTVASKLAEMARAANFLAVSVIGLVLLLAGAIRLLS